MVNEQTAKSDAEIADRAKDMFLATLSHELRTPLNAIVGWISILRLGGAENLAEGLDVIERNTMTQVQLIDDILDVSRIISGKLHLEMADCNLVSAINAGIDNVRPALDAKNISIEGAFDSTANRAFCDEVRIQQVIWNLLTNAIKFSNKGSHILVTLSRESSKIRIAVSDEGQGISEDLLPFVFDRFRQADSSTRRKFGGLGLGLSIVKHLTEMHGGTVEAKSDGVGLGSTFSVHLPIKPVLIKDIEAEVSKGTSGDCIPLTDYTSHGKNLAGLHLLVVDDEPDARRMLVKVLGGLGARVTSAASATEAIDVLADTVKKNDRPDVLISDIGMPNQDGYDLIRTIRQLGHRSIELPAIALTAFAREADSAAAVLAGFQVYHCKPVDIGELTASIVKLAGRIG